MSRFHQKGIIEAFLKKGDHSVLKNLFDPPRTNVSIKSLKEVSNIEGGGTQSKGYILTLTDGYEFFVKETSQTEVIAQMNADKNLSTRLGEFAQDSPFVKAKKIHMGSPFNSKKNGLIISPKAQGMNLAKALKENGGLSRSKQYQVVRQVGHALSQMQLNCMKHAKSESAFYEGGCRFDNMSILVHPDFQFTNIIVDANRNNVAFVDTGGLGKVNDGDNYLNIQEFIYFLSDYESSSAQAGTHSLTHAFLQGYLSSFPEQRQSQVLNVLREMLPQYVKPLALKPQDIPSIPVKPQIIPLSEKTQINQMVSVQSRLDEVPLKSKETEELERKRKAVQYQTLVKEQHKRRKPVNKPSRKIQKVQQKSKQVKRRETDKQATVGKKPIQKTHKSIVGQPQQKRATGELKNPIQLDRLQPYNVDKPIIESRYSTKQIIANKAGKLLFELEVDGQKLFWKQVKGKQRSTVEVKDNQEVSGSRIANYITKGLVPVAHLRTVDTKMGLGQEMITFDHFKPNDPRLDKLTPKQVAQIMAHLIADKMCSNYDCHFDNFGIDPQGNIVGVDKGEAFRFFKSAQVGYKSNKDSDTFDLTLYGKDEFNFYKAISDRIKDGRLQVDFDDPIIQDALDRVERLTSDDIKKLYSPYAELQWKQRAPKLYDDMKLKAENIRGEFNKLQQEITPNIQEQEKENIPPMPQVTMDDTQATKPTESLKESSLNIHVMPLRVFEPVDQDVEIGPEKAHSSPPHQGRKENEDDGRARIHKTTKQRRPAQHTQKKEDAARYSAVAIEQQQALNGLRSKKEELLLKKEVASEISKAERLAFEKEQKRVQALEEKIKLGQERIENIKRRFQAEILGEQSKVVKPQEEKAFKPTAALLKAQRKMLKPVNEPTPSKLHKQGGGNIHAKLAQEAMRARENRKQQSKMQQFVQERKQQNIEKMSIKERAEYYEAEKIRELNIKQKLQQQKYENRKIRLNKEVTQLEQEIAQHLDDKFSLEPKTLALHRLAQAQGAYLVQLESELEYYEQLEQRINLLKESANKKNKPTHADLLLEIQKGEVKLNRVDHSHLKKKQAEPLPSQAEKHAALKIAQGMQSHQMFQRRMERINGLLKEQERQQQKQPKQDTQAELERLKALQELEAKKAKIREDLEAAMKSIQEHTKPDEQFIAQTAKAQEEIQRQIKSFTPTPQAEKVQAFQMIEKRAIKLSPNKGSGG